MFSLIITIISIALVAALALATIYYGGDAFTKGGDAAKAAQFINEGQQLQGALTLRTVQEPTAVALVDGSVGTQLAGYLAQAPANWAVDGSAFTVVAGSPSVCAEVNAKSGHTASDVANVAAALAATTDKVYFCDNVGAEGAEVPTVIYRF